MWFVPFKIVYLGGYLACPPVDGPKDPWPRVLSLPERFVGDPASLAHDSVIAIRSLFGIPISTSLNLQFLGGHLCDIIMEINKA